MNQLSPFKQHNQTEKHSNSNITEQEQAMLTMDFDSIPDYLCHSNPGLENKIKCILPTTIKLEELRDIAILMHKMMSIGIIQSLWIMYQKSGTGNLPVTLSIGTNQINRKIWPKQVLALVKRSHTIYADEDNACLMFVNYCLNDLNEKSNQYRHELNIKTSRLHNYTRSLEHNIEKFVEKNLQSLRMEMDEQIALIQYHYTDQIFYRVYLAQNPKENQVNLFKVLFLLIIYIYVFSHPIRYK